MHGSRPDLFQLRQLFLAVVMTAAAIGMLAVAFCSGTSGFSQSAAMVIAIAKMSVASEVSSKQSAVQSGEQPR